MQIFVNIILWSEETLFKEEYVYQFTARFIDFLFMNV